MKRPPMTEYTPAAWGIVAGLYTFLACMAAISLSCATVPRYTRPLEQRDRFAVRTELTCDWAGWNAVVTGSGTIIGETMVLTAQHCTVCAPRNGVRGKAVRLAVVDYRGSVREAVVTKEWYGRDIARLGVATTFAIGPEDVIRPPALAPLGNENVITSAASPMRSMTMGRASGARTYSACPKTNSVFCHDFTASAPVMRGNSGGAVYNARGAIVGVITGGRFENPEDVTSDDVLGSSVWPIRSEIFAP